MIFVGFCSGGGSGEVRETMKRIIRIANQLGNAMDREKSAILVCITLVYIAITSLYAMRRLWFDEVYTDYMCRLPDLAAVWSALKEGADFNPPLFYIATRASLSALGGGLLGIRLPAVVGFLVMCSACSGSFRVGVRPATLLRLCCSPC